MQDGPGHPNVALPDQQKWKKFTTAFTVLANKTSNVLKTKNADLLTATQPHIIYDSESPCRLSGTGYSFLSHLSFHRFFNVLNEEHDGMGVT